MKNTDLVSVIMPVYNADKYIRQSLESILNQTHTNLEILIADDASTDNSKHIVDSYEDERIFRFHNRNNIGYLATCNLLFEKCSGDYITFQDADDWSAIERIEILVNTLSQDNEVVLCGSNFARVSENGNNLIGKSDLPLEYQKIKKHIDNKNQRFPILGGSVMVKKSILHEVGYYREYFNRLGSEHVDWMIMISENYEIKNTSDFLYYYRYVNDSFSRVDILNNYKKYYSKDIVYFLKEQRKKYGFDALQDDTLEPELKKYLESLNASFISNRRIVMNKVLTNRFNNNDLASAREIFRQARSENIASVKFIRAYYLRMIKTLIKMLIGKFNNDQD